MVINAYLNNTNILIHVNFMLFWFIALIGLIGETAWYGVDVGVKYVLNGEVSDYFEADDNLNGVNFKNNLFQTNTG